MKDEKKQQGIQARNREYIEYDQVEKKQDYRFAEAEGKEEFDDDFQVRALDMQDWYRGDRKRFAASLGQALEEIGFAVLMNHGVDPSLYREAERTVFDLFGSTTVEDRKRFTAQRHGSVNEGYFPIKETADIHPDLVEGWVFGNRAMRDDAFWPDPKYRASFGRLVSSQCRLVLPIMQAMLTHLGCEPTLFDARLTDPRLALRLNYYPPISEEDDATDAGRLLGHEDVTMFTLLPAPTIEGLQALSRKSIRWVRIRAPEGSVILNTGDYMQRISNDRFPSTTHRVSKPRNPADRRTGRASFPLNIYLREEETMEVLPGLGGTKYEPIRAITFHTRTTAKYYGDEHAVDGE